MFDPLLIALAILALVLVLVALSVWVTPRLGPGSGVTRGTRFFLVLLRLAIGWHFLFEGVAKLTDPNWSSEGYLREASGPLAGWFQDLAGDRLKERLTVGPDGSFPPRLGIEWQIYFDRFTKHYGLSDKQRREAQLQFEQVQARTLQFLTREKRPVKVPGRVPPVFEASLTVPQRIQLYEEKLAQARRAEEQEVPRNATTGWALVRDFKAQANLIRAGLKKDLDGQTQAMREALDSVLMPVHWLQDPTRPALTGTDRIGPDGTLAKRLQEEWDDYFDWFDHRYQLTAKQHEAAKAKLAQAKERMLALLHRQATPTLSASTVAWLAAPLGQGPLLTSCASFAGRTTLKPTVQELKAQTQAMTEALDNVLTGAQKTQPPPSPVTQLPLSYIADWSRLDWADFLVKWGLLLVGLFLIAGLFTRTACVAAALFLLSFYLAMPPLPGLPENPRAEGHYLYINKNLIEMLACLALATTASGLWAGLDGLLQFLFPRAWRSPQPAAEAPEASGARPALEAVGRSSAIPSARPSSEEITHGP
jgi:uncharacterized membrane protein YphA (DoxX/SURF4 family)